MPKKGANISLSSYDDIFETDASRAEAKQERIQSISILDLVPFKNHPFIAGPVTVKSFWKSTVRISLFTKQQRKPSMNLA